jgi:hypothetical protein
LEQLMSSGFGPKTDPQLRTSCQTKSIKNG